MLAKEIKIKLLKRQRDFIEELIKGLIYQDVDNQSFIFFGRIYSENIKYFEGQGCELREENAVINGLSITTYLISLLDVKLSKEELEEAEAYDYSVDVEYAKMLVDAEYEREEEFDYEEDDEDVEQGEVIGNCKFLN